jgi:hypothetical protein
MRWWLLVLAVAWPGVAGAQQTPSTSPPPFRCTAAMYACSTAEQILGSASPSTPRLRLQEQQVCGANCVQFYWLTNMDTGALVLELEGRGASLTAETLPDGTVQVRTRRPEYPPGGALCCPAYYTATTYTWDAGQGALTMRDAAIVPAENSDVRTGQP